MSRRLSHLRILPAFDSSLNKILPDSEKLTPGFVCMPEEYPAKIVPWSQAKAELIRREWDDAEKQCLHPQTKQWLS